MPLKPAFVTSLATAALALLAFPAIAQAELPLPAEPQPAEAELQPGLAVRYYAEFFRHIDQLIDWQEYEDGKEGPPLPNLDYRTGTGRVLTSERSDGTGAEITGFIKLDKPGDFIGKAACTEKKAQGVPTRRLAQVLVQDAEPLLFHAEVVHRNGAPAGYVRSGSYGYTLGGAVGLFMIEADQPVDQDYIDSGEWEIDIAGTRYPATVSLKPMYDPDMARIKA